MRRAEAPASFFEEEREGLASRSDFTCDRSPARIASKKVLASLMSLYHPDHQEQRLLKQALSPKATKARALWSEE
jgi:hypothetical protein